MINITKTCLLTIEILLYTQQGKNTVISSVIILSRRTRIHWMFEKCVIEDLLLYLFAFKLVFPVIPATSLIEFVFFCTLTVDKLRLTFGWQETNHHMQVSLWTNKNNTATLSFLSRYIWLGMTLRCDRTYVCVTPVLLSTLTGQYTLLKVHCCHLEPSWLGKRERWLYRV